MNKIELEIIALSHSMTQSNSYAVVLGEVSGIRRLPIVIGAFEAQAIAVALENIQPSRPLTHDLLKNFMSSFGITLQEIIIHDLQEGIFYSKLICYSDNDTIEIDSRTSDAIALAVRFGCPIYANRNVIDGAGIIMDDNSNKKKTIENISSDESTVKNDLSNLTLDELQTMLNDVLEHEDYMRAIAIRDEINRRK